MYTNIYGPSTRDPDENSSTSKRKPMTKVLVKICKTKETTINFFQMATVWYEMLLNALNFEQCKRCKMRVCLQRSVLIRPRTGFQKLHTYHPPIKRDPSSIKMNCILPKCVWVNVPNVALVRKETSTSFTR